MTRTRTQGALRAATAHHRGAASLGWMLAAALSAASAAAQPITSPVDRTALEAAGNQDFVVKELPGLNHLLQHVGRKEVGVFKHAFDVGEVVWRGCSDVQLGLSASGKLGIQHRGKHVCQRLTKRKQWHGTR